MAYLVLARKYRPTTFSEVVGQEHVTRTLANAFATGRVHHAFLFCGPRGVGKTTLARILGKALNCVNGPTSEPCGVCEACVSIAAGNAVDYYEMDGASNRGIDAIRELTEAVRYQPAMLRKKVYVIDEVHMLTTEAFNALLKTLEEPPPHVTFVLATTEPHKVPVTILSRCQRYDFKLVPTARLLRHLESILVKENITCDPGALNLLAREAGGSVRDALSLTDQIIAFAAGERVTELKVAEGLGVADHALLDTLLGSVVRHQPAAALVAIDAAVGRGVDIAHLARTFLAYLRDAAVVQAVADAEGIVDATPDEIHALRELVSAVPRAQLMALFDRFANACEQLKDSPAPRLIVEVALIDMAGAEPLAPISEMVERLERIESRLKSGAPPPARAPARSATPPASSSRAATVLSKPAPGGRPPPPVVAPAAPVSPVTAPVAPPAPPATRPSWPDVVARLPLSLAGTFAHARPLGWNDKVLELGFSSDFHASVGREAIPALKKTIAELTSAPVDVKISLVAADAAGAPPSIVEAQKGERQEIVKKREEEARSHPVTDAVIKTFGATIKEIKVDG